MRRIAAVIVGLVLPLSFASSAEATRPIVGFKYHDVCKNIKQKQTILDVHAGYYEFNVDTTRRNDCVRMDRSK